VWTNELLENAIEKYGGIETRNIRVNDLHTLRQIRSCSNCLDALVGGGVLERITRNSGRCSVIGIRRRNRIIRSPGAVRSFREEHLVIFPSNYVLLSTATKSRHGQGVVSVAGDAVLRGLASEYREIPMVNMELIVGKHRKVFIPIVNLVSVGCMRTWPARSEVRGHHGLSRCEFVSI
jgi:hypothetical protein